MIRVAVDIGGTFTDLVAIDDESSRLYALKIRSTPFSPEDAFVEVVRRLISENDLSSSAIDRIIHVGTIGSNLFLGQLGIKVPKTALVTTRGFRDVLEIGRQNRSELYNVFFQRPKPLVPRKFRFEVRERTDSRGTILASVNEQDLHCVAKQLKQAGIDSVAISFINSYLNPENERKAKDALDGIADFVCVSSEIDPEHREYERTSTTVANAVLARLLSRYLDSALTKLNQIGITAPIQLLSSSGGLVELEVARRKPIVAVESGPAAGVVGAAEFAKMLGQRNILSLDMGGTTAKAGCVADFTPLVVPEMEVGGQVHAGRTIKGSGYPVRYPSVDLAEVSAGGGTIIWADEIGTLSVGPISAGANPGPACYGSGGQDPTITDANLILGRLGPTLLGKEMHLDIELANRSMEQVARKVGMSAIETAAASIRLVNLHMAKAVDIVSLERGQDPSKFSLIAFGGAGPMHGAAIAEQVGVNSVIIPPHPGLFSALGMTMTDMKYNYVRGTLNPLDKISDDRLEETWRQMTAEAVIDLKPKTGDKPITVIRSADVRYLGQGYELEIQVPSPFNRKSLVESFEERHEAVYGYRHAGERLEITALRLTIVAPIAKPNLNSLRVSIKETREVTHRRVWFKDEWFDTPVYWRDKLPSQRLHGPLIIEEYDSTVVVPPNWECDGERNSCVILERIS